MRKSIVLTLIAVLAALVAVPANAAEATQEEVVCVWDGEKGTGTPTKKANVVAIGDPVPGLDGKVFNEECLPVIDKYLVSADRKSVV